MRSSLMRAAVAATVGLVSMVAAGAGGRGLKVQAVDPLSPPPNRVGGGDGRYVAFTGATVRVDPDTTIKNATLVVRNGVIESVKEAGEAPAGTRAMDARGLFIYPGFVDPFVEVDATRPDPQSKGAHWNYHVMPQRRALDGKGIDEGTAESLRKLGFVAAGLSPRGGVFRGSGAAVSLAKPDVDPSEARPAVYNPMTYQAVSFEGTGDAPGGADGRWGGYPSSQMGAIALIRQTMLDAQYRSQRVAGKMDEGTASCLDALLESKKASDGSVDERGFYLLFSVNDELEELRAAAIAAEFQRTPLIVGNGTEYKRLDAFAKMKRGALIVPLNFPEKPRVAGIGEASSVELRELMSWEQAPTNARRLKGASVEFALTSSKLRDRSRFRENLRQAIRHGLSERDALAAITVTPAAMLGIERKVGTIAAGKAASFIVADGPIFEKKTKLLDVYCDGVRHMMTAPAAKMEGVYAITLDPVPPGEAKRFITIDAEGGVTVRRAVKEEKPEALKPDAAKPDGAKPDAPTADAPKPEAAKPEVAKVDEGVQPPAAEPAPAKPAGPVWKEKSVRAKSVVIMDDRLSFVYDHEPVGGPTGIFTHAALVTERDERGRAVELKGDGMRANGEAFRWSARRVAESDWMGAWRVVEFDGKPKPAAAKDQVKMEFSHTSDGLKLKLTFTKEKGEPTVIDAEDVKIENGVVTFKHPLKKLGMEGDSRDTVKMEWEGGRPVLIGEGLLPDGSKHPYKAERWKSDDEEAPVDVPEKLTGLPFGPYAREKMPEQLKTVVLKGGTVWTSGPNGKIENADVVVQGGKVVAVGKDLAAKWTPVDAAEGVLVIDCTGKHITPGIIDCHSHTGISRGVNEGGQSVTAEVRVGDVTSPDAISWYRQLAGGVTIVNNLHGSANTIGGQNQVNKIRWGVVSPSDMHFEGAIPGIKFALGENVKGGNSTQEGWRYPQTRMGVETLLRDRFTAAKEYAAAKKAGGGGGAGFRRDLELDALAEILAGERLIHCHSYRQDEVLMLGRMAQEFGFKLGTYQHILEGYKVADILRETSGGGSCFADWWAYKVEVQDAIPQAGAIMHEQGVVVSFNSDDDGMARRMNVEAAKGHKYSRLPDGTYTVSEEEALKFVTINPAKQLRIDDKVGSIEVGKDGDIAVWSGSPLSSMSRCERTFVDGRQLFSLEDDAKLRERDGKERQRLIQKILADKGGAAAKPDAGATPGAPAGAGGPPGGGRRRPPNLIETMLHQATERRIDRALDQIRLGKSVEDAVRGGVGDCGCDDLNNWSIR